ncbi:pyridoxal phosphate-dependent transferase, partial [Protomyces lactucae-debilis]
LGHARLADFDLKEGYVNLNAGSFGVCPKRVREAYNRHSLAIEANPDLFLRFNYADSLAHVRRQIADLIRSDAGELAFVTNATVGVNTILRSLASTKVADKMGMAYFSTIYGACGNTVEYLVDHTKHIYSQEIPLAYPISHADILQKAEALLQSDKDINVFVFDLISSLPGVKMPWVELIQLCRKHDVYSVVDAAHGIGHVPLDLQAANPDFLVSNCHKWLYGYRSTAILHVPSRNQHLIHALPTGHGYLTDKKKKAGLGKLIGIATSEGANAFIAEFEYPGTVDMAGFLALEESIAYRASLGGEACIREYCQKLVQDGAEKVAQMLGTSVLQTEEGCSMAQVVLPIDWEADQQKMTPNERSIWLIKTAMDDYNCCFSPFVHNRMWYARLSAQIFNELKDFEYVGTVLTKLLKEM